MSIFPYGGAGCNPPQPAPFFDRQERQDLNRQERQGRQEQRMKNMWNSTNSTEPPAEVDRLAHEVIGAAIEVHRILGPGFLESVYDGAMRVEFQLRAIPFVYQWPHTVDYKGQVVGGGRLDFLIGESLILELKAVDNLLPIHFAQMISYLRATSRQVGLLINFHETVLRDGIKRIVLSNAWFPLRSKSSWRPWRSLRSKSSWRPWRLI